MSGWCKAIPSVPITQEAFLARVTKTPKCWLFGKAGPNGDRAYGVCGKLTAHRVSYVLFHGPIPAGFLVRHKCDVPRCVNPDHLELGKSRENAQDARDRAPRPHLYYRIRTGDGCTKTFTGNCSDRQGLAVYLIGLLGDKPDGTTRAAQAVRALLDACGSALAENGNDAST